VFDLFTELAKRAVVASQDAALALGHDFIGTEHQLIGLAGTAGVAGEVLRANGVELGALRDETVRQLTAAGVPATGGSAAKDALSAIGIDVAAIQRQADATFGSGEFVYPRPAYNERAKKALELSVSEARELGHAEVDTEHLLLGLLSAGDGVAVEVLTVLHVDVSALRSAVLARVAGASSISGATAAGETTGVSE
jgi:ATP-dependent Clp protease ATP-binding subunit ClpA